MSEPTKFDYQLALTNLAKLDEVNYHLRVDFLHAQEDLADLREQLAQMTRQRDEARERLRVAQLRTHDLHESLMHPAPSPAAAPEKGNPTCAEAGYCLAPSVCRVGFECPHRTRPAAALTREPEREVVVPIEFVDDADWVRRVNVRITPDVAAAILRLAAQHGEGV